MEASTDALKDPGAFAEPPLNPGPLALTAMPEGPPAIENWVDVLDPCWTLTEAEAGATAILTPEISTVTLTPWHPPEMEIDPL